MKTTKKWCEHFNVVIKDPDGWRPPKELDFDIPISEFDFLDRLSVSTVQFLSGGSYIKERIDYYLDKGMWQ